MTQRSILIRFRCLLSKRQALAQSMHHAAHTVQVSVRRRFSKGCCPVRESTYLGACLGCAAAWCIGSCTKCCSARATSSSSTSLHSFTRAVSACACDHQQCRRGCRGARTSTLLRTPHPLHTGVVLAVLLSHAFPASAQHCWACHHPRD